MLFRSEEEGGPFVLSIAEEEIAQDDDPSNPRGATREPFPMTSSGSQTDAEGEEQD